MNKEWYQIENISEIDSPALAIYPDRVRENIRIMKSFVPDVEHLRPHVKTNKSAETTKLLLEAGIYKFKCATIAEAEMLAIEKASDILLAYQPLGPKILRLSELVNKFPTSKFSCLIDNVESARNISAVFEKKNNKINVFIDLNIGMNRTGIIPEAALDLFDQCQNLKGINIIGLHPYDGHLRDPDLAIRTKACDEGFAKVEALKNEILKLRGKNLIIVVGGTTTFSIHSKRKNIECSPGTIIYWDKGYQSMFSELPFLWAAVLITRIISKPDDETICIDLGHKSVASENPLNNRVYFLNGPELQPVGHSEEHMTLNAGKNNSYEVGDVLYGIPYHICPTVALHDETVTVVDHKAIGRWVTTSRRRRITA